MHEALMSKIKEWLARNQNIVFGWSKMSTRGLLFSELEQTTSNSVYWSSTEVGTLVTGSRHDIAEQLFIWRQTITTHSTLTQIRKKDLEIS